MDRVVGIGVVIGALAAIVAAAAIWLLLTDPVTVATSLETGDVSPLVRQLADVIFNAISGLLSYSVGPGLQAVLGPARAGLQTLEASMRRFSLVAFALIAASSALDAKGTDGQAHAERARTRAAPVEIIDPGLLDGRTCGWAASSARPWPPRRR